MAASVPPVIMTSASSYWMARRASPMALAAEAQAVATAVFGPHRPKWIEMLPAAALAHHLGDDERADAARPALRCSGVCCSSNSLRPPMPLPMMTPQRNGSSLAKSRPLSLTASMAATRANWAKRSSRRAVLASRTLSGSKFLTSPPKWTLKARGVELLDRADAALAGAAVLASSSCTSVAERVDRAQPGDDDASRHFFAMLLLDVVDGLADGLDLLGLLVGDGDLELLFELHDQLDDVERVGADVLDEGGLAGDLLLVDAQFSQTISMTRSSTDGTIGPPTQATLNRLRALGFRSRHGALALQDYKLRTAGQEFHRCRSPCPVAGSANVYREPHVLSTKSGRRAARGGGGRMGKKGGPSGRPMTPLVFGNATDRALEAGRRSLINPRRQRHALLAVVGDQRANHVFGRPSLRKRVAPEKSAK